MNKKLLAMLMIHITGARSRPAPIQRHPPHPDDGLRAPVGFPQWRLGLLALSPADLLDNREPTPLRYRFTPYRQFSFGLIVIVEVMLRTMLDVLVLDESGTLVLPNNGVRGLNPLRSGVAQ